MTAFLTNLIHDGIMKTITYWTDTIPTGRDSTMVGIMDSPGIIDRLEKLFAASFDLVLDSCPNLADDEKKRIRDESWRADINAGEQPISGLMFDTEQKRDRAVGFLNTAVAVMEDDSSGIRPTDTIPAENEVASSRNTPRDTFQIGDKPPSVIQLLVVCVPHRVGVGALKADPLAPLALLRLPYRQAVVPHYAVYGIVRDMYSLFLLDQSLRADGPLAVPAVCREDRRVFPATRKTILGPTHASRVDYPVRFHPLVPGPQFLYPDLGDAHGICNLPVGRFAGLLLQDYPLYL